MTFFDQSYVTSVEAMADNFVVGFLEGLVFSGPAQQDFEWGGGGGGGGGLKRERGFFFLFFLGGGGERRHATLGKLGF